MTKNKPMRDAFFYFRQAWSPKASYHLARVRYADDWRLRMVSIVWLINHDAMQLMQEITKLIDEAPKEPKPGR